MPRPKGSPNKNKLPDQFDFAVVTIDAALEPKLLEAFKKWKLDQIAKNNLKTTKADFVRHVFNQYLDGKLEA